MPKLRSTGVAEREQMWAQYALEAKDRHATWDKKAALVRAQWINGAHPARRYLREAAPVMSSPGALLKRAGAGVIVVSRSIMSFLGGTTVYYDCIQHSLAAEVALSYIKSIRKNKKKVKAVVTHAPTLSTVADVSVTAKMNVQIVPALSNTQITKHPSRWVPTQCEVKVAGWTPSRFSYQHQEILVALPRTLEEDAVASGALVHVRNKDTVVIRVQRDKALNKALDMYFKVPQGIAYKLNATCVTHIQKFLA